MARGGETGSGTNLGPFIGTSWLVVFDTALAADGGAAQAVRVTPMGGALDCRVTPLHGPSDYAPLLFENATHDFAYNAGAGGGITRVEVRRRVSGTGEAAFSVICAK